MIYIIIIPQVHFILVVHNIISIMKYTAPLYINIRLNIGDGDGDTIH
jgi:hypothetical protein